MSSSVEQHKTKSLFVPAKIPTFLVFFALVFSEVEGKTERKKKENDIFCK